MRFRFTTRTPLTGALIAAVFMLATPACYANAPREVGRVSVVQGKVTLTGAGGKISKPRLFSAVFDRDRIEVPEKSSLRIIFYADNHEEMVRGWCIAELHESGAEIIKGSRDRIQKTRTPPLLALTQNSAVSGRDMAGGIIRGDSHIPAGNFLQVTETPTFTWCEVSGAGFYGVSISEVNGDKKHEILNEVVSDNSLKVPEVRKLHFGGQYEIELKAYLQDPRDPLYKGLKSNEISPDPEKPGMKIRTIFTLPGKETVNYILKEEVSLRKLKKGSPEWLSASSYLMLTCLEFGLTGKAGSIAEALHPYESDSEVLNRIRLLYH